MKKADATAARIRKFRAEHPGLSLPETAKRLGLSRQTVYNRVASSEVARRAERERLLRIEAAAIAYVAEMNLNRWTLLKAALAAREEKSNG